MELPTYFADFLKEIRLTQSQIEDCKCGHETLVERLTSDEDLSRIIVSTFLQGSYRRATAVRPYEGKRADVDVVVVTRLSEQEYTPAEAMNVFLPFLERYYKEKYELQGRSIGISLSYVDLDLVITSAPSESEIGAFKALCVTTKETPEDVDDWRLVKSWIPLERRGTFSATRMLEAAKKEAEWQLSPLRIPDREAKCWQRTHPLAQIQWTFEKSNSTNKHYVNVVKAIKWWRRIKYQTPKYPKSYPLEHLIGQSCPDGVKSVAEGITVTLENIAKNYLQYAITKTVPMLPDHGVPEHNVFKRVTGEDFAMFHAQVCDAAKIARTGLDATSLEKSVEAWQELFGDKFPDAPSGGGNEGGGDDDGGSSKGSYSPRGAVTTIGGGRFG